MSCLLEKKENNEAIITITVSAERFEEGINYAFNKNKNEFDIPGFRKGKVPRQLIESQFGKGIFYDEAIDFVFPDAYRAACEEIDETVVSRPSMEDFEISENGEAVFKILVTLKPPVSINKYKGFTYNKVEAVVTDEEVEAEIDAVRRKNSRLLTVTDRPAELGDTLTIDFIGFVNGEPFEGGKAEDYAIELGSHSFIDDFEEQLIGYNVGDVAVINVSFPDDYHAEQLAGAPARFDVTVKDIQKVELPVVDDEFAQDVSEFDTLDEYKDDIRAKLLVKKEESVKLQSENEILSKLTDELVCDIPDVMIENEVESLANDFKRRVEAQGMKFEQYLHYTGETTDSFKAMNRPKAEQHVKLRLALEEVVASENIEVSDEDFNDEIGKIAQSLGIEAEKFNSVISERERKDVLMDIKVRRAIELVIENAVVE